MKRLRDVMLVWLISHRLVLPATAVAEPIPNLNLQAGKPFAPATEAIAAPGLGSSDVDADLFTGQATMRIPILVPAGTGGLTPSVSLRYASHASNQDGPLGAGWSLDLGIPASIQRSTRDGAPSYDASDAFDFGDEALVATSTAGRYVSARFDHSRIERVVAGGADYWRVLGPDGTRLYYGFEYVATGSPATENLSRLNPTVVRALDPTPPVCLDPFNGSTCAPFGAREYILDTTKASQPYSWHLDRVEDRNGNVVRYRWSSLGNPATGVRYLASIEYSDHVAGTTTQVPAFGGADDGTLTRTRIVRLTYGMTRPEAVPTYRAGFPRTVRSRLTDVNVEVDGELTRHYVLAYATSAVSGRSLLASVRERGADDSVTAELVHTFGYTNGASTGWGPLNPTFRLPASLSFVDGAGRDRGVRVFDVNGDGWADVIEGYAGTRRTFLGGPAGFAASSSSAWAPPADFADASGYTGLVVANLDRDGLPDFLRRQLRVTGEVSRSASCEQYPGDPTPGSTSFESEIAASFSSDAWTSTGSGWEPDESADLPVFPIATYADLTSRSYGDSSCPLETFPTMIELAGVAARFDQATRLVDLNGDGLDDVVYRRELSNGRDYGPFADEMHEFRAGSVMNSAAGLAVATPNHRHDAWVWADIFTTDPYFADFVALHQEPTWQVPRFSPSFVIDGDEAADVGWSKFHSCKGYNLLAGAYTGSERLVDLNGDGLPELMQAASVCPAGVSCDAQNPNWLYPGALWVNNGYGWQPPGGSTYQQYWQPLHNFIIVAAGAYDGYCNVIDSWNTWDAGARFLDLNGDGGVDVLSDGSIPSALWQADQPFIWVDAPEWNAPFAFLAGGLGTDPSVRIVDVNADGLPDILEPGGARLNVAEPPDKLNSISGPYGAATAIIYEASTITDVSPMPSDNVVVEGQRRQGAPVWAIRTIAVAAGFGQPVMTRTFSFFGPVHDVDDHAFRGFTDVYIDGTTAAGQQRQDYMRFHTRDALRGKPAQHDVRDRASNQILKRWFYEYTYASAADSQVWEVFATLAPTALATSDLQQGAFTAFRTWVGNASARATLALPTRVEERRFERAATLQRTIRREWTFDVWGNAIREIAAGDIATSFDDVTTTRSFGLLDSTVGGQPVVLADRPYEVRVTGSAGGLPAGTTVSRRYRMYYDGSSTLGSLVRGNLTKRVLDWTQSGQATSLHEDFGHDAYGNLISALAPMKQTAGARAQRILEWDSASRTFPISSSIANFGGPFVEMRTTYDYEIAGCGAPLGLGLICRSTPTDLRPTTRYYDSFGRLTREAAPNGAEYAVLYHDAARGTTSQRIEVRTRWDESGPSGTALATDSNALIEQTYFDGLRRPVEETRSGQGSSVARRQLDYNGAGDLAQVSRWDFGSAAIFPTTFIVDPLGRRIRETLPDGSRIDVTIDAFSILTEQRESSIAGGAVVMKRRASLDGFDQLGAVDEYPDASAAAFERTSYLYDPFGNLVQMRDAVANDPSLCGSNPACPTQRHVTSVFYDEAGNRVRLEDADSGMTTWVFDDNARVRQETDATGRVLTYSYGIFDRLERVHPENPPTPEADRVFTYGNLDDADSRKRGRLIRVDDDEGYDTFAYDDAANVSEHARVVDGKRYTFVRDWDPLGRVRTTTYPDGESVTWTFDKAVLTRIVGNGSYGGDYVSNATWDAQYRPTNVTLGGSAADPVLARTHAFVAATNQLDRITGTLSASSTIIADADYTVDGLGRVAAATYNMMNLPAGTISTHAWAYTLDGIGRLRHVDRLNGTPDFSYSYDALGNLVSVDDTGSSGFDLEYRDPLRPHALSRALNASGATARQLTYDAAGRTEFETIYSGSGVNVQYAYDSFGRPASDGRVALGYDWLGNRVRTYVPADGSEGKIWHPEPDYSFEAGVGVKHFFVAGQLVASSAKAFTPPAAAGPVLFSIGHGFDASAVIGEHAGAIAWSLALAVLLGYALRPSHQPLRLRLASVAVLALASPGLLGGRPRAFGTQSDTAVFYVTDHAGSVLMAVQSDGTPLSRFAYLPYGGAFVIQGYELERRYVGERLLMPIVSRERYALGPRLYDPDMGRFYQPDPLGGDPRFPQTFNAYGYAEGAPLDRSDPSGLSSESLSCDRIGGCGSPGGLGTYDQAACSFLGICLDVGFALPGPVSGATQVPVANVEVSQGLDRPPPVIGAPQQPRIQAYLAGGFETGGLAGAIRAVPQFLDAFEDYNEFNGLQTGGGAFGLVAPGSGGIWTATRAKTAVQNAFSHFQKHGFQFPQYRNALEYVRGAQSFLRSPPAGALTQAGPRGIRVYDPATNTFAAGTASGVPRTMFKPDAGARYWPGQ